MQQQSQPQRRWATAPSWAPRRSTRADWLARGSDEWFPAAPFSGWMRTRTQASSRRWQLPSSTPARWRSPSDNKRARRHSHHRCSGRQGRSGVSPSVPVNFKCWLRRHRTTTHKLNKWKKSAYKDFDERENSGGLTHDYLMSNGCPVREVPLNNDAGSSIQPRTTWNCSNDITAQHEFGERHPFLQQNGFSQAEVLPNIDAGPSKQDPLLFSHHNYEQQIVHQGLRQHVPSMPQNGTPYNMPQGNILNDQRSFSAQPTVLPHILLPVPEDDDLVTGASLTSQQNGYLSFSTTDAPGTSYHVADAAGTFSDGVSLGTSSLNHVQTHIFSRLTPIELQELLEVQARLTDQDFVQANIEPPNSNSQFHGYEHDGGDI